MRSRVVNGLEIVDKVGESLRTLFDFKIDRFEFQCDTLPSLWQIHAMKCAKSQQSSPSFQKKETYNTLLLDLIREGFT